MMEAELGLLKAFQELEPRTFRRETKEVTIKGQWKAFFTRRRTALLTAAQDVERSIINIESACSARTCWRWRRNLA